MGCFGSSKSNKVVPQIGPELRKSSTAPGGTLEVEKDWHKEAAPRQISDNGVAEEKPKEVAAAPQAPVTPSGTKQLKQGHAADASPGLATLLPQAVTIPDYAQGWTQILPEHLVRALYSSDWKDREQGVNGCAKILAAAAQSSVEAEPAFNVGCEVLKHALKDKVVPMYFCSLELLSTVLQAFVGTGPKPAAAVPLDRLRKGVASFVPILVHRYSNLNARIQDTSLQALLSIATTPSLGIAMITPLVLPQQQHGSSGSPAGTEQGRPWPQVKLQARLSLTAELLNHLGTAAAPVAAAAAAGTTDSGKEELRSIGLDEEAVLQLCREGLDSAEAAARMHGMRTLAELHRFKRVRGGASMPAEGGPPSLGPGLEAETCVGPIKLALVSLLSRRFAEVDAELSRGGSGNGCTAPAALSIQGTGSMRASFNASSAAASTPVGSRSSMRHKSQLPPLVGSGSRSAQLGASIPPSPAASMRMHTPLATHQEHVHTSSPGIHSKAANTTHSPLPDSLLNAEDEQLLDDIML